MHDDSVLIAVEEALRKPAFCDCGTPMHLETRNNAIWLECDAFERPSRLPDSVASFMRFLTHDRVYVVDLPEAELSAAA